MDQYLAGNGTTVVLSLLMLLTIIIQALIIWKQGWGKLSYKLFGLTVLAFLAVFAGLTVSDTKSASGVFGLLGIISGYLIGKDET